MTVVALLGAFFLRFSEGGFAVRWPLLAMILPYFVLHTVVVCYAFQLTVTKWRFYSLPDLFRIVRAATVLAASLLVLDYILLAPNMLATFFFGKQVIFIFWLLEMFLLSGPRLIYRYFRYTRTRNRANAGDANFCLLVGRAADAEILLRGIESGAVKNIWPVGVLSPSRADRGHMIRGLPVLGGIDDVSDVVADFGRRQKLVRRIIMTPSAFEEEAQPEVVINKARQLGLVVSRLPSLAESGDAPQLTAIAVEDLLLRPGATIDYSRIESFVRGKAVIVTGGGGSIGAEICERLVTFGAARLLIIENSEPVLHAVLEKITAKPQDAVIEGHLADVRDRARMFALMRGFAPDMVFHAAALKHVPILERDWSEAIKTNIVGSINVADAADAAGAAAMVMISTDKAIEPVSMLGLTKRFAEMYCQALDRLRRGGGDGRAPLRLISVRFGNVLASTGSVVPKFRAQIEAGGPVTVTHPDMVRYFMTIQEACDLVITAASHALSPPVPDLSVYVLNMGQPVKILDLAERMIRLSGLEPGRDIEIVFTGIRPGERLNEKLFAHEEPTVATGIAGIVAATPNELSMATLKAALALIEEALAGSDRERVERVLRDTVPEFRPAPAETDAEVAQTASAGQ
ncbi:MAG: polysaccharide biosynthesis protein [Xanthobacteraceae bacterium]|nr:MAG: polysaccharide biosynthesis protein [Xanthobacteraceae bacterium]